MESAQNYEIYDGFRIQMTNKISNKQVLLNEAVLVLYVSHWSKVVIIFDAGLYLLQW